MTDLHNLTQSEMAKSCPKCGGTGKMPLKKAVGWIDCDCGAWGETKGAMSYRVECDYPDGIDPIRQPFHAEDEDRQDEITNWQINNPHEMYPEPPASFYRCPQCYSTQITIGYPNIVCRHCGLAEPLIDYPISYSMHRSLCQEYGQRDPGPDWSDRQEETRAESEAKPRQIIPQLASKQIEEDRSAQNEAKSAGITPSQPQPLVRKDIEQIRAQVNYLQNKVMELRVEKKKKEESNYEPF